MCGVNGGLPYRLPRWRGLVLLGLMIMSGMASAQTTCPKLLMFDGVEIHTQTTAEQARYWGRTVGIQGFFVKHVMNRWQQDVGVDPQSKAWQQARRFQRLYSREGVTDNFIKVAIYKRHDWRNLIANSHVVGNFAHAAALAKYAGFKGMALDLEPYVPIWGGKAGGPKLASTVYREARAIGLAMRQAYPGITLILLPDALVRWDTPHAGHHGGYGLSAYFERGLLSAGFKHVVFAIEHTYNSSPDRVVPIAEKTLARYRKFIRRQTLPVGSFSIAPGLWPLGKSHADKSARMSPGDFSRDFEAAYRATDDYVWIYGAGSAWQSDGPYGKGPAVSNLDAYAKVIKQVRDSRCR